MKKILKYGLIAITIIIPISFVTGHELAKKSDPFVKLNKDIISSSEVAVAVGQVQSISLGWFGYMVKTNGPSGRASFDTTVVGSKGSVRVSADLKRSAGKWETTEMNVFPSE